MKKRFLCTALSILVTASAANAEIIRCEVTDRSHRLMPEWIEYEFRERGLIVEVRDSVGAQVGVDWVRGDVIEKTTRRQTIGWNVGMIPIGVEFPGTAAIVNMRMTWLPNGSIQVVGVPSAVAYGNNTTYQGTAQCRE